MSHADNDWLSFSDVLERCARDEAASLCSSPSQHPWDTHAHTWRRRSAHSRLAQEEASVEQMLRAYWRKNGARSCTSCTQPNPHHLDSGESKKLGGVPEVFLIDGTEMGSLWYMHGAGRADRGRWKGAALSEWQEHYQSIFHRCQRGLVPVPSSGCHLLNEGMKGMFKVEIQACLDKGLYIVTGWKIAFEPSDTKSRAPGFH